MGTNNSKKPSPKGTKSSPEVKTFERVLNDFKTILKLWARYETETSTSREETLEKLSEIYKRHKFSLCSEDDWPKHKTIKVGEFMTRLLDISLRIVQSERINLYSIVQDELLPLAAPIRPVSDNPKNFGYTLLDALPTGEGRRLAPLPADPADPASPGTSPLIFVAPVLVLFLLMLLWRRFQARPAPKRALVRHGK